MSELFRKETAGYVATETLYLSSDGKIVREGDHRAASLLAAKGHLVSHKVAKRLSLDKAQVEPLDAKPAPPLGFHVAQGGFNQPAAISPQAIESRSTRPEPAHTKR